MTKVEEGVGRVQKHISNISAIPPTYEESCEALGLDPQLPRAPGVYPVGDPFYDEHPEAVQFLKAHHPPVPRYRRKKGILGADYRVYVFSATY